MKKLFMLGFIPFLLSCGGDDEPAPSPTLEKITLSETNLSLKEGEEHALKVSHFPSNMSAPSYVWRTSNPNVVGIDNGHVKALSEGNAIVTCTVLNSTLSASCNIVVNPVLPETVSIAADNNTIFVNERIVLSATILPENAKDKSVTWESSDISVATINSSGEVQGISPGEVTIIVRTNKGNLTASFKLQVKKIDVEELVVNPDKITILRGETTKLNITVLPTDATYKEITWKTENENIAKVTSDGTVMGCLPGDTRIKVISVDNNSATTYCDVHVTNNNDIEYNPYGEDENW